MAGLKGNWLKSEAGAGIGGTEVIPDYRSRPTGALHRPVDSASVEQWLYRFLAAFDEGQEVCEQIARQRKVQMAGMG
jgi:hypothetical protein